MKFKDLTEKEIELFGRIYKNKDLSWDERMKLLMEMIDKSERTVRKWSVKLGLKERIIEEPEEYKIAKEKTYNKNKQRFIITWAQNNTPVNERFLHNIKEYGNFINADIHIIAGRYKNPTSIFADKKIETWDSRIIPYLDANRHDIHRYVSVMSDVKIQPTAVNPMTGLQAMSGENSCVFGSPKVQMEMIAVLEGNKPKMMVTTGACTEPNYTDSKVGKKGEFHHTLGFVVIEIKNDDIFYMRQVTANEIGDFTDLYYKTTFKGSLETILYNGDWTQMWVGDSTVTKISKIAGIVYGDIHFGEHDQRVLDKTLELLNNLEPEHVVLHDTFNGHSISHHERKDPFIQYKREMDGSNSLKLEVDNMYDGLKQFKPFKYVIIVKSNHDDFPDRWLKDVDWRKTSTPKNSLEYMEYAGYILSGKATNGIIPYLINQKYPEFITLDRMASYKIKNFEVGQHGDYGSNGSRGSLVQYRKLNTKIIVAHYHTPGRKDGALSVGTSTHLRVGYNTGASSWLQTHVIIHDDGKAQHINFIDDENGEMNFTTFIY